jgi:hypothetical protein
MDTPTRPRVTAADRARRRLRIFARMQEGWSYEAIAEEEKLSRERIRQIVKQSLDRREVDPSADYLRLQIARLDPALRLAAAKVAAGDLRAIDRLLRVLDRMDKYQSAVDEEIQEEDEPEAIETYEEDERLVDEEAPEPEPEPEPAPIDYRAKYLDRIPPEIWKRYDEWKYGSPSKSQNDAEAIDEAAGAAEKTL